MCEWENKYNELKDKYDKLACKIIVNKLKGNTISSGVAGSSISTSPTNITLDFSVILYTEGLLCDRFIEVSIVPYLKQELDKLDIWDK